MKRLAVLTLTLAACPCLLADVYKLAIPTDKGMHFVWWPVLPAVPGWRQDEGVSRNFAVNMLVPNGQSFESAPAVIYGKANYKPRTPETKTLQQLVRLDTEEHLSNVPGLTVANLPSISTGDGHSLVYRQFAPQKEGAWELVAYGEEGEYFLLFVASAQTKAALEAARPAFERMISGYAERPNKSLQRTGEP